MDSNQKLLDLSSSDQPLDCYPLFKWEYTLMGEVGLKMVWVCVGGEDEGEGGNSIYFVLLKRKIHWYKFTLIYFYAQLVCTCARGLPILKHHDNIFKCFSI